VFFREHMRDLLTVHARHVVVQYDQIQIVMPAERDGAWTIGGAQNSVASCVQQLGQGFGGLIVNVENRRHRVHLGAIRHTKRGQECA